MAGKHFVLFSAWKRGGRNTVKDYWGITLLYGAVRDGMLLYLRSCVSAAGFDFKLNSALSNSRWRLLYDEDPETRSLSQAKSIRGFGLDYWIGYPKYMGVRNSISGGYGGNSPQYK